MTVPKSAATARRSRARPRAEASPLKASADRALLEEGEGSTSEAFISFMLESDPSTLMSSEDAPACIYLIHRITALLRRASANVAEKAGIHVSDLYILILLNRRPPEFHAMASELQRALGFTSGGITRRVDRLEEAGLVVRTPHEADRRVWMVKLTPAGHKTVEQAHSMRASQQILDLVSQLDGAEWTGMLRMLRLLEQSLSNGDQEDAAQVSGRKPARGNQD